MHRWSAAIVLTCTLLAGADAIALGGRGVPAARGRLFSRGTAHGIGRRDRGVLGALGKVGRRRTPLTRLFVQRHKYIAINGGDLWAGFKCTPEELEQLAAAAASTSVERPVMQQFHAGRGWLWRQWMGTIFRSSYRTVLFNSLIALVTAMIFSGTSLGAGIRQEALEQLTGLERLWRTSSGLVTFVLSFFLNQAYSVWRKCYSVTRRIQGRLNDLGLLAASHAERVFHVIPDPLEGMPPAALDLQSPEDLELARKGHKSEILRRKVARAQFQAGAPTVDDMMGRSDDMSAYTPAAAELLSELGRYNRLFNVLVYASVSRRHAPLATPEGLKELQNVGLLLEEEKQHILRTGTYHNAVIGWISALLAAGIADGRLRGGASLQMVMLRQVTELRATYATVGDELTGRMPLAYTHLVQILVDLFVLTTPLALTSEIAFLGTTQGPLRWGFTVVGTAVLTLFYSGILDLAKMFLDPFDNEDYGGGRIGVRIDVDTLMQESNLGSRRWFRGDAWLPKVAMRRRERERRETADRELKLLRGGFEEAPAEREATIVRLSEPAAADAKAEEIVSAAEEALKREAKERRRREEAVDVDSFGFTDV